MLTNLWCRGACITDRSRAFQLSMHAALLAHDWDSQDLTVRVPDKATVQPGSADRLIACQAVFGNNFNMNFREAGWELKCEDLAQGAVSTGICGIGYTHCY